MEHTVLTISYEYSPLARANDKSGVATFVDRHLGAEVKEVHDAVLKLSDAEGEAVDLARVLHQCLSLLISEHVVSFVWFSCHLGFKD